MSDEEIVVHTVAWIREDGRLEVHTVPQVEVAERLLAFGIEQGAKSYVHSVTRFNTRERAAADDE